MTNESSSNEPAPFWTDDPKVSTLYKIACPTAFVLFYGSITTCLVWGMLASCGGCGGKKDTNENPPPMKKEM